MPRQDDREFRQQYFARNKITEKAELKGEEREKLKKIMEKMQGTKKAVLIDENLEQIKRVSAKDLVLAIPRSRKLVYAVVSDGTVTSSVVRACEDFGVKHLVAKNFAYAADTLVNLISV